jgi:polyisoprenoid-binding protein YceI
MTIPPGSYTLGPQQATLTVRTGKTGAASKAGHNLLIEVTSWSAELHSGEDPGAIEMRLTADSSSLRVLEGTGGLQELGDDDKIGIGKTIKDEILKRGSIEFRSSSVEAGRDGGELRVHGELDLLGTRRPITFELRAGDDGTLTGRATITQSEFGIKPYSTLFGALKVVDNVQIAFDGHLPAS